MGSNGKLQGQLTCSNEARYIVLRLKSRISHRFVRHSSFSRFFEPLTLTRVGCTDENCDWKGYLCTFSADS